MVAVGARFPHHAKIGEGQKRPRLNFESGSKQTSLTEGEAGFLKAIPSIELELESLFDLIDSGAAVESDGIRLGVFNPFWRTFGGGEAHALDVADALSEFGWVDLISESDFDLDALLEFFGRPKAKVRKRIVASFTASLSREYDIFVNAAYQNETPSEAKASYFILSFPSKTPTLDFLESYTFLANSKYTMGWSQYYWGATSFVGHAYTPRSRVKYSYRPQVR